MYVCRDYGVSVRVDSPVFVQGLLQGIEVLIPYFIIEYVYRSCSYVVLAIAAYGIEDQILVRMCFF